MNSMKVVTCASYYGSGSSALTDLVSEYDDVKSLGDYEIRILYDIDGVSDLEFHLTECHNRHNSGHAIKRFERLIDFYSGSRLVKRYESFFGGNFATISHGYINQLVAFSFNGWWFYDLYDKGRHHYFIKQLENHLLRKFTKKYNNILKNTQTYCSCPSKEYFYECTREFTHQLFSAANEDNAPYLVIDQLVPSENIDRILRYFKDDVYTFVINRDPRDVYMVEMVALQENVIPHDPYLFCKWFRYTHSDMHPSNNPNVVYLNFEDFIYNYDKIVDIVQKKLGLTSEQHSMMFEKMNPMRSINNTQIFKKDSRYKREIEIIEKELSEYLYPFDAVSKNLIPGIKVDDNGVF